MTNVFEHDFDANLEKHEEKKTIDDISLDLVIMAPDEIRRLDENG